MTLLDFEVYVYSDKHVSEVIERLISLQMCPSISHQSMHFIAFKSPTLLQFTMLVYMTLLDFEVYVHPDKHVSEVIESLISLQMCPSISHKSLHFIAFKSLTLLQFTMLVYMTLLDFEVYVHPDKACVRGC